ncbi:hypothetical protein DPMN_182015 [Dreissena polymorpha]|uniref:Uncharacterized protein n=1 Tax=Dreissena polymorpha TaxID=45954 RepID=A0A9D4DDE3_DREPO|nr:hypothetical protein DPMN_182015 [Dreissena polymorpha]
MYWYETQVILACIGAIHGVRKRTKGSIRKELGSYRPLHEVFEVRPAPVTFQEIKVILSQRVMCKTVKWRLNRKKLPPSTTGQLTKCDHSNNL